MITKMNVILKGHSMSFEQTTCQAEVVEQQSKRYIAEKINDNLEAKIEQKFIYELDELKLLIKSKEGDITDIIVKLLSYTNSQTAKNGYKEEELICKVI